MSLSSPILIIENPDRCLYRYNIQTKSIVVGRDTDSDIILQDMSVSRKHLQLLTSDNRTTVIALNENNPVIVVSNSEDVEILAAESKKSKVTRVVSTILNHGDFIKIGKFNFHFIQTAQQIQEILFREHLVSDVPPYIFDEDDCTESPTCVLTPEETRQLFQEERLIASTIEGKGGSWIPGSDGLTFGKKGTIVIKSLFSADVVAELLWKNGVHHLIPKGGWMSIKLNNNKITESTELRDQDVILIGRNTFVYNV